MTTNFPDRLDRIEAILERVVEGLSELDSDVEKLDYKFETYEKASDKVFRLTTTIIIAAASVVILSPVLQAVAPAVAAFLGSET